MRRKEKRQRNKFSAVLTGALILSTFFNAGASVSFAADNAAGGAAENGTEVSEQAQAQSFRIRTYNDRRAEDDRGIKAEIGEVPLREQRDLADCGRSYDGPEWSAAEKRRTEIVN